MKKAKFKAKSRRLLDLKIYEKITEGWAVVKYPKKNWLGTWVCKMEKN